MIKLTVLSGSDAGSVFTPSSDSVVIGRGHTCDVVLHDKWVGKRHCTITRQGDRFVLTDLRSVNGTFLNNLNTHVGTQELRHADDILLGKTRIRVELLALTEKDVPTRITLAAKGSMPSRESPVQASTVPPPDAPTVAEHLTAVRQPDVPIVLTVVSGPDRGKVYSPPQNVFSIGRAPTCQIVLHDDTVSRFHATIKREAGKYRIYDENTRNGTFLGTPHDRVFHADLSNGDVIFLGRTQLRVEIPLSEAAGSAAGKEALLSGTVGETLIFTVTLPPRSSRMTQSEAVAESIPAPPAETAKAEPPHAARPESRAQPAVEDVQPRSPAFKKRLEVIRRQGGVILRPFTMPGSPCQWAALILMLLAAVSSYGFLSFGRPLFFAGGPVATSHTKWENQCATCHPAWGLESVNATCVQADCHANVLKAKENVHDDCVSCHSEHRGRAFNIAGGERLCWKCHEAGLGVQPFKTRPLRAYYEQVFVASGATASKSGMVVDPLRMQPPATEAARRAWQQSVPHMESGLIYGHVIHEKDVKAAGHEKGVACFDCHKQLPQGQISAFPTHAECIDCHKEVGNRDPQVAKANASEQCLKCHTQKEGGIVRVQREITYVNFSHNDHTETSCERCHFVVRDEKEYRPVLRSAVRYPLPMDACYTCHEQLKATVACLDCHREHHSYPPTTQIAGGWFSGVTFNGVLLMFVAMVVGAGAYTYFDTRLTRRWLESLQPPPPQEAGKAPEAPARAPASAGDGGVLPFPIVDASTCISCSSCYDSCPTKVLAGDPVTHKSTVVNPQACKALEGCTICQDGCPNGSIRVTSAPVPKKVERAQIDEHNESNIPGLFLAGQVVGAELIKKAVNQGDQVVRYIFNKKPRLANALYDVIIVGAGPGGLSAGLQAKRLGLRYLILEKATIASTIRTYERDKAVLAEPVLLPLYGLLPVRVAQKEELIAAWEQVVQTTRLQVNEREEVTNITKTNGLFTVTTVKGIYKGAYVILAIGTRGNPRKMGIPGEDPPKVAYNLIDAADFKGKKVLVVGGGDSAIEAAVALSKEEGTTVTLSYRGGEFGRIKSRNAEAIAEQEKAGKVTVLFNSEVIEIRDKSVTLKVGKEQRELENDAVFALIGADPPNDWLKKIGINIVTVQETPSAQW